MNHSVETLASEAMRLPEGKRLALAHRILSSVEPAADAEVEAAWDAEIRERIRRYDAGLTQSVPAPQVFTELDNRLKR